jgi:ankyrin repeat protein
MRLLFDPTFAPAEGAFLGVLEACAAGNETAVVAAALLLGVSFPVDEDDQDDQDDQEDKTRVFEVDATDNEGNTPLLIAIRTMQARCPRTMRGLCGVVELLLAAGATVAAKNEAGMTALMLACVEKKEEAAAMLTEATKNAAALDVQDTKYKRSALHYASSSGLESIVAKLLSLGADVALKDSCGKTALDVATNDEVKAALRQHGARHSLFYAAEEGMLELVADLIKEGADVNERNQAGNTAVDRAQNAQTIDALKGAGATMPEFPEEEKNDLLIQYAKKGLMGGLLMALQVGADVNHKDGYSRTALHWAAYNGHDAVAQGLLGAGADVNAKDEYERTPLHLAAFRTPLQKPEVAKVLLAHGAQVNAGDDDERTPLHLAAYQNEPEVAKVLLAHGARLNVCDNDGRTALGLASSAVSAPARWGCPHGKHIQTLLLQHGAE